MCLIYLTVILYKRQCNNHNCHLSVSRPCIAWPNAEAMTSGFRGTRVTVRPLYFEHKINMYILLDKYINSDRHNRFGMPAFPA